MRALPTRVRHRRRRDGVCCCGRVQQERTDEVVDLPVERVPVDQELLERAQARDPGRKGPQAIVPQRERVEPRELRERVGQGGDVAVVGEEDVEGREGAEKRRQDAGREWIAVDVELFEETACADRSRDLGQSAGPVGDERSDSGAR